MKKDSKANVRDHPIKTGDKVLLWRKTTKHNSVYEAEAYTVTGVYGTQVETERDGQGLPEVEEGGNHQTQELCPSSQSPRQIHLSGGSRCGSRSDTGHSSVRSSQSRPARSGRRRPGPERSRTGSTTRRGRNLSG